MSHLSGRDSVEAVNSAIKEATPLVEGVRKLEAARCWTCTSKIIEALGLHGTLRWRCPAGHVWSASLHTARLLAECRECAMERRSSANTGTRWFSASRSPKTCKAGDNGAFHSGGWSRTRGAVAARTARREASSTQTDPSPEIHPFGGDRLKGSAVTRGDFGLSRS